MGKTPTEEMLLLPSFLLFPIFSTSASYTIKASWSLHQLCALMIMCRACETRRQRPSSRLSGLWDEDLDLLSLRFFHACWLLRLLLSLRASKLEAFGGY